MVFFGCGSHVGDHRLVSLFDYLLYCIHGDVRLFVRGYCERPENAPIIVDGLVDQDIRRSCSDASIFSQASL